MNSKEISPFVENFCNEERNKYFVPIDINFIQDPYNLEGITEVIPECQKVLEILTSKTLTYKHNPEAEKLFGLLHSRYVQTIDGIDKINIKYMNKVYGTCPRYFCNNTPLMPTSNSDEFGKSSIKLYCPCCKNVYNPPTEYSSIDSSFFGKSFTSHFLKEHPEHLMNDNENKKYNAKIFGFELYSGEINENIPEDYLLRHSFVIKP